MKKHKKTITVLLTAAALLIAVFMTGCAKLSEAPNTTSTWLAAKNNDLTDYLKKLELVDDAYQKLLTNEARELLDSAGCEAVVITWGSEPIEPVEAIMQAAGLRG